MTDEPSEPELAQETETRGPRRAFSVDGVAWTVRLVARHYDRRSGPDLVFESADVVRRVRSYPADWFTLSDEALFAISHRR